MIKKNTFKYQTLWLIEDKPNYKMKQAYQFVLVIILTICSIILMLYPNLYPEEIIEADNQYFMNVNLSVSKSTQINFPGFQPPILSEPIKPCQKMTLKPSSPTRPQLQLFCNITAVWSSIKKVPSTSPPFLIDSSSLCLEMYIQSNCYDEQQVPNVVHYVWFSKQTLDVYTYLSVISVYKTIRPCLILFHGDYLPLGDHWTHLLALVPNIIFVQTVAPTRIFGKTFGFIQHKADIARLQILHAHGGIYYDVDQIPLKSFDKFRQYQVAMSYESDSNTGNAVIVAKKAAPFIDIWYQNYKSYNPKQWDYHSTRLPLALSKKYPDLIHVEKKTFFFPGYPQMPKVFYGHEKWSDSTAIHLYDRLMNKYFTLDELRTLDTSLGEIARHILYNSTTLCK